LKATSTSSEPLAVGPRFALFVALSVLLIITYYFFLRVLPSFGVPFVVVQVGAPMVICFLVSIFVGLWRTEFGIQTRFVVAVSCFLIPVVVAKIWDYAWEAYFRFGNG